MSTRTLSLFLILLLPSPSVAVSSTDNEPDVTSYHLTIEPDIDKGSIRGTVVIRFQIDINANSVSLNAGELKIDRVTGENVLGFENNSGDLVIKMSERDRQENEIMVDYHGSPTRGLLFNPDLNQAHTVYFTDHWMICNNKPNDRASISLNIVLPKGMQSIASGTLMGIEETDGKVIHKWHQAYETPSYTYGLAIGTFTQVTQQTDNVTLYYYSSDLDKNQLEKVFAETANILKFFKDKSGVKYIQDAYSQVLIGDYYQEMSGLSVLASSYPSSVLKDSSEIHLTSHELAHQWWGNMITCENFGHFWLNEAFAVYMASAFSEHRFGREKYLADISIYKGIYNDLVEKDKDRSLVFKSWQPSRDNRNVIYYKGAYVLHLLREEIGDEAFWQGVRTYSIHNFGKSVKTDDFKLAMEKATGSDLDDFFNKWVYKKER